MGTINYGTSDYITIGLKPCDGYDLMNDADFVSFCDECGYDVEEYSYIAADDYNNDDYENIKAVLNKYDFYYFHISVEQGYYEGFYVDIQNNFPVAFDDAAEKREAQKEVTRIGRFLHECVDNGLCEVWPGWCPSYKDRETTLKSIQTAILDMRAEVKSTPTWKQYERSAK